MADRSELDRLSARLADVEGTLDDVALARGEARLRRTLAATKERAPRRRAVVAVVAAAAVAVGLTAALLGARRPVTPSTPTLVLRPYSITPLSPAVAAAPPDLAGGDRLDVPAGWRVRASLGAGIAVGLDGPSRLVVAGTASAPVLRVDGGRLLVDVTPGRGTHLRVATATLELEVVGTLFSIDASGVAVRHGRVRVRAAGAQIEVDAGHRVDAAARALAPIDPDAAGALDAQHAAPPREGVLVTIAGEPSGAEVREGALLLARTPARLRLSPGAELGLTAPGHVRATITVPESPTTIAYGLATAVEVRREDAAPAAPIAPRPAPLARRAERVETTAPTSPGTVEPARAAARPSGRALYREVNRALAAGDNDAARAALLAVIGDRKDPSLADAARVDLAGLALRAGELAAARRYLGELSSDALAEPAAHLRCRIAVAARDAVAADCLAAFRASYPASPHALEALVEEGVLRADGGDCGRALPLLEAAAARTLTSSDRTDVEGRRARCRRPPGSPSSP